MTSPGLRRCLAVIAAVIALVATQSTWATAQTSTSAGGPTLALMGQSDWNTGTDPFDLQVKIGGSFDSNQTELVVTVFNQVRSRSQFQQSEQDHITGNSLILERHTLGDIMQADNSAAVSLPIQDATQKRYYLKDPGIYPVRVELRTLGSSTSLTDFVTDIINEPAVTGSAQALGVLTVLPVQAAQSTDPKKPLATPDNGQPFETVGKTLAAHPSTPATLIAEPESMERLTDTDTPATTHALDDFKSSVNGRTVAKTTWAPLPPALYTNDTSGEVTTQMNRGTSILNAGFPTLDNEDWFVTDQADTNSLGDLKNQGFSRVIVPETDLTPQQRPTTLVRPFNISLGKSKTQTIAAGMADQQLSAHFSDPQGPILGAHRLLADMAVLWNDLPGAQRAVVVEPPRAWNPDPGFLETLFRGLDSSPILKAQTPDQYFDTPTEKTGNSTLSRTLVANKTDSAFPTSRVSDSRRLVDGFGSLVDPDNAKLRDFQQELLLSERAELNDKDRGAALDNVRNAIDHELSMVQLPPERSIRLTARNGQIPVSVQNDTGYTVHVKIELTSNKVGFPDGNNRVIDLTRQHVTEAFAIDARTSGAFPLQVRLLSPDGMTTIEHSSITIHSTATSAIGVGLSIGAGLFLIVWWIRSAIRTHRKKKLALA